MKHPVHKLFTPTVSHNDISANYNWKWLYQLSYIVHGVQEKRGHVFSTQL